MKKETVSSMIKTQKMLALGIFGIISCSLSQTASAQQPVTPVIIPQPAAAATVAPSQGPVVTAGRKTPWDLDGDGIPNDQDPDDDNDGLPDTADRDSNGDGMMDHTCQWTTADGEDIDPVPQPGGVTGKKHSRRRLHGTGLDGFWNVSPECTYNYYECTDKNKDGVIDAEEKKNPMICDKDQYLLFSDCGCEKGGGVDAAQAQVVAAAKDACPTQELSRMLNSELAGLGSKNTVRQHLEAASNVAATVMARGSALISDGEILAANIAVAEQSLAIYSEMLVRAEMLGVLESTLSELGIQTGIQLANQLGVTLPSEEKSAGHLD